MSLLLSETGVSETGGGISDAGLEGELGQVFRRAQQGTKLGRDLR